MSTNSAFRSELDIANRALQHAGSRRIATMTENSREADEVNFNYNMLRQAELRRNVWRFAIRNACLRPLTTTTKLVIPALFDTLTAYIPGDIVDYNDIWYQAVDEVAAGTTPTTAGTPWKRYFGPTTADVYYSTVKYYAGELVYTPAAADYKVYLSLVNENDQDPTAYPAAYDATTTYDMHDTVTYLGDTYQSVIDLNYGNTPGGGEWELVPVTQYGVRAGRQWLDLGNPSEALAGAAVRSIVMPWPLGSGPSAGGSSIFALPQGFLREAPEDPRAGGTSPLGAPAGLPYTDRNLASGYFTSADSSPTIFRFVADVDAVPDMDPLFCEGLAARIALEVAPTLTQSDGKLTTIGQVYTKFMGEARAVNGIETGPTEAPEDDYITCRR